MREEMSLDITSKILSLADIERALMLKGGSGSRSIGNALPGDRVASTSVLRLEPNLDERAALRQQIDAIRARMPADRLRAANLQVEVIFNIAVYFDTACATTIIDPELVALIADYSATIQVMAYPVSD
jgi:hypothetical protein